MIESYIVLAERIRKEMNDLERLVARATRAMSTAKKNPQDADLFLDSASLNMHDVYSGLSGSSNKLLPQATDLCLVVPNGIGHCWSRWPGSAEGSAAGFVK